MKNKKTALAEEFCERLEAIYPDAICALEFGGEAWKLLIMGRLSAQCTDARVNEVCKELFAKFPNAEAMAAGDIAEIEEIVKPCGLYRMKADNIKAASRMLVSEFGGELPSTMDELLLLPGVGRKIANLLLGDIFGKEAIVCDTHCIRICGRLGMYPENLKDPTKIEKVLSELIDRKEGSDFCHRIVIFGREVCTARSPMCTDCTLSGICYKAERDGTKRASAK